MNQNPEQFTRDKIDEALTACGWLIQNKKAINLQADIGVAVREYSTNVGPADYVLFVDKKPVGIIEAKRAEEGVHLTVHEDQSLDYATTKLKYLHKDPLPFVYKSTGEVTHFNDYRSPKPRQGNLGIKAVTETSIPFCSIERQKIIVEEIVIGLSVADKLEATITNCLQQAEALKQSILRKAFAGKLV